jgi:hypothetical protein
MARQTELQKRIRKVLTEHAHRMDIYESDDLMRLDVIAQVLDARNERLKRIEKLIKQLSYFMR